MSLKQKTIYGVAWSFVEAVFLKGLSFVAMVFLARWLGPIDFGLMGMIAVFIGIGTSLVNSGMTSSIIRTKNAGDADFTTVFYMNMGMSLLVYAIMYYLAPYIAAFYGQEVLIDIIRVYSLVFIISAFSAVQLAILNKEMRFKRIMLLNAPSIIIGVSVGLFLGYNNYGANQFPEKLIPLFINNIIHNRPLPVYGDGNYTRDWLYVIDHAIAIDLVFHKGLDKETYNIGGFNEWKNIDLVKLLCRHMDEKLGRDNGSSQELITYVKDRPGHDLRYAIDASKINRELGWSPTVTFEEGLSKTIDWYLANKDWLNNVTSGAYQKYYQLQYK